MPETYGLPETEAEGPTVIDEAVRLGSEAVAGQGLVRTVLLYALTVLLIASPLPLLASVPVVLLMASDRRLSA